MKIYFYILTFFLATILLKSQPVDKNNNFTLSIDKYQIEEHAHIIPWVKENDKSWYQSTPTFEIKDMSTELSAKGWIAITSKVLLIKIEVFDDTHINEKELGELWGGDAVQIGIDPHGDGSGYMPKETQGMVGFDDAGLGFALDKNGAEGFAWFLGSRFVSIKLDPSTTYIYRNEVKKTTIYNLSIPWELLFSSPGKYPSMGISIQINDTDPNRKEQNRISWGKGAGGASSPGLFEKIAINKALLPVLESYNGNNEIWTEGDKLEINYSIASKDPHIITAKADEQKIILTISGSNTLETCHYKVTLKHNNPSKAGKIEVKLKSGDKIISESAVNAISPSLVLSELYTRIDSILKLKNNHFLFIKHLKSIKALVMSEWAKSQVYNENIRARSETFRYICQINEGLKKDAGKWQSYITNERTLIISYISKRDGTLQYYMLDLPKNRDTSVSYPLFVELHGAGNPNPIAALAAQLGSSATSLDLRGYTSVKSYSQQAGLGYHIVPFGRGNSRYRDIGEIDVFEAYHDVHNLFKIDEERRYLYGFSMGGAGTWSIGLRTPDLWAAIGIFAGSVGNEKPAVNLAGNLLNTPIYIWCGDKDGLYPNVAQMKKALESKGITPEIRITKGLDHKYPDSIQAMGQKWMTQHKRKRPNYFTFLADKDEHTGIWGITMTREESISGLPYMECKIEGQTVNINTKGTSGLKIVFGDKGLKMKGHVTVIWNGEQKYEGEAPEIIIGRQVKDAF